MNIDFTGVALADFYDYQPTKNKGAIQEEIYTLCIDGAEAKTSRSGNPMLVVTLIVAEGEAKGKSFKEYFMLHNEKALPILRNFLTVALNKEVPALTDQVARELAGKMLLGGIGREPSGDFINCRLICCAPLGQEEALKQKYARALERFRKKTEKKTAASVSIPAVDF